MHTHPLALLCVAMLYTAAIAEEEAISDRGKTALGVSLLGPKTSLSIWRVNPNTMWGFELDYATVDRAWQRYTDGNRTLTLAVIRPSLTFKQIVGPLRYDVAPFLHQTAGTLIRHLNGETYLGIDATLGVGVIWFPFKRISLAIRQGVTLEFQHEPESVHEATSHFKGEKRIKFYAKTAVLYALVHF